MVSNVCPRCGKPYSYIKRKKVGRKVYLYAVHYLGYEKTPDGKIKKKVKECYLGPEDSYEYVSMLHEKERLKLKGLIDDNRALEYLDALINYVSHISLDGEVALSLAEKFEALAKRLREYAANKP